MTRERNRRGTGCAERGWKDVRVTIADTDAVVVERTRRAFERARALAGRVASSLSPRGTFGGLGRVEGHRQDVRRPERLPVDVGITVVD
jgi:hypothetical protein